MLKQLLMRRLFRKYPVVEFKGDKTVAKIALEVVLAATVIEHLLGLEVANEFLYIVVGSLARQKLTR